METKVEVLQHQKTGEEVVEVKNIEIPEEELNDLKHKAEVSSQNFERAKKAEALLNELEKELLEIKNNPGKSEFSDEGKVLKAEIDSLKESGQLRDVVSAFPALADKTTEFQEFRKGYPGVALNNVAKLFLQENGLLEVAKPRKGLINQTGGGRQAPEPEWTSEKVDDLMKSNYNLYVKYLKEGRFKSVK